MKKIAVIIPNYNGFKYSERCFKALENQTFKDFVVCVVDDCSTDDSYEQLIKYADNTCFEMKVIGTDCNRGPGFSRKLGIENTESEWIAFCDIDDWYDDRYLDIQFHEIEKAGADIAFCDNNFVYDDGRTVKANATSWCKSIEINTRTTLAYGKMSLCRIICRRDLFVGINIPCIYYGEDAPVTIQLIANSSKQIVTTQSLYNYFIRSGSASTSPKGNAVNDYLLAYETIENSISSKYSSECEYIGINMILYGVTLLMYKNGVNKKEVRRIVSSFKNKYPLWCNNEYLFFIGKEKKIYLWAIKNKLFFICHLYARLHGYIINRK